MLATTNRCGLQESQLMSATMNISTMESPLMDILYSGHLIIQDKMLRSELNLHYA